MIYLSDYGLTKEQALCALYNHASCFGMGFLHYQPGDLSIEKAISLLKSSSYFDYLSGRLLKVNLSGNSFDERLYDRDNGYGAAEWALLDYATSPKKE